MLPHVIDSLPPGFLDAAPEELRELLGGPTLVRIAGKERAPVFVSILLHGNETTGLFAVQEYLRTSLEPGGLLPRPMILFVGNVDAAQARVRMLNHQADYNRIWSGGDGPEQRMATEVLRQVRDARPFAAIDIHNNTGRNPLYACINRIGPAFLHLAGLFSPVTVYFTEPHEVISNACAGICPAVTLECGQVGDNSGIGQIVYFLDNVMQLERFHGPGDASGMTEVYHTIARMKVPPRARLTFDPLDDTADCCLAPRLDRYNFKDVPAGLEIASRRRNGFRIDIRDNDGRDCADVFLDQSGEHITTARSVVLAMMTPDLQVIEQDCFGYLMEHYPLPEALR